MDVLSLLGWILLSALVTVCLFVLYVIAWMRASNRSFDRAIASQRGVRHTDILFEEVPKPLKELVCKLKQEYGYLGFSDLLTGARLSLADGGADVHYHIVVSPDKTTVVEILHLRMGMTLGLLWPAPLPFFRWFGISMDGSAFTLVSFCTDHTTLATTTEAELGAKPPPKYSVVLMPPDTPFGVLWNHHRSELRKLVESEGKSPMLFDSREAFFEKERIQREQRNRKWATLQKMLSVNSKEEDSDVSAEA